MLLFFEVTAFKSIIQPCLGFHRLPKSFIDLVHKRGRIYPPIMAFTARDERLIWSVSENRYSLGNDLTCNKDVRCLLACLCVDFQSTKASKICHIPSSLQSFIYYSEFPSSIVDPPYSVEIPRRLR